MQIYSKKIIRFVDEIKKTVKHILSQEIKLRVFGERFYDQAHKYSYPIKVVIYNNKSLLGYFNSDFYELGFHECLMRTSREQLHDIIRHELAHYMTFIEHGYAVPSHGNEFRAFCYRMGWGDEISKATTCLVEAESIREESSVLRKVQKLMALSTSSNKNEAEQAMIKSQQLLLKHNIDATSVGSEDEEQIILKRILKQKKENAKMRSIALILETFFVSTIYSRGGGFIYLEIIGSGVNVEIADYVATFLDCEMDKHWETIKKQCNLKGMVAKNSFFLGIAKGYCNKINSLKREYHPHVSNALLVIEKKLVDAKEMVYPRLSYTKSHGKYCSESSALGERVGRQLNINPGVGFTSKQSGASLTYSR